MSVVDLVASTVKRDQRERFLSRLKRVLDAMRHEKTFGDATLHRDPESEHRFLLHEIWAENQDALDVQLKRPYRDAWRAPLDDIHETQREISFCEAMRADHAGREPA